MAWTGFGGSDRNSGNSIGRDSGFGRMGPNDPYGGGSARNSRESNGGGGNNSGRTRTTTKTTTKAAPAKTTTQKPGAAPITTIAPTIATPEQKAYANSLAGRVNGFLGNVLGIGDAGYNGSVVGGFGMPGTISGTLMGAISGARTGMSLGPGGAILGALGGMISGSGVLSGMTLDSIRGYNPNYNGRSTAAQSEGPGQTLANGQRIGQGNGGTRTSSGTRTASQTNAAGAGDQSVKGLINALTPSSAGAMVNAGNKASSEYLNLLRGRYGKYLLTTGATGSGTGLLGRTAGGTGAIGGTSGRVLLGG